MNFQYFLIYDNHYLLINNLMKDMHQKMALRMIHILYYLVFSMIIIVKKIYIYIYILIIIIYN